MAQPSSTHPPHWARASCNNTVELEPGGTLASAVHQRFVYVLEGEAELCLERENYAEGAPYTHPLRAGAYAYLPPGTQATLKAKEKTRAAIIEKKYSPLPGTAAPAALFSHVDMIDPTHLNGDPNLLVRALLPADFAFDFAVNTMTYEDGAALSQVEIHVMEHGLLMLEGHGPYRLGDDTHEVQDGDFIWMAPFCPQWFKAAGAGPAKYLIYKDFNRVPAL